MADASMTPMLSRLTKLKQLNKLKQSNQPEQSNQPDAFLISSPASVKYFSGYFFYFEYGPSPFHLLPAILMALPDGDACLILADNETGQAFSLDPLIRVSPYESYTYETAGDPVHACITKIAEFIDRNHLGSSRIGMEPGSLPFVIANTLSKRYPALEWVDVTAEIIQCRRVKDPDELAFIRQAAALADIGQEAVLKYARPGITELELFSLAHRDIEASVGYRVPVMADLSSGSLTCTGGGMPSNKKIAAGDLVLSDFQPCLQGYWGDSCSTIAIGTPTNEQEETFTLVREALEIGIEAIKPGVMAKTIDQLMRAHIGHYPHHSGHSVGTAYHESPRITPYNETVLESGMLIALEPAIYKSDFGIRLEHLMAVTETGCEVLTKFRHRLEP